MKLKPVKIIMCALLGAMLLALSSSGCINAETQIVPQPDANIDIKGGFAIKAYITDIRENATTPLPVDIWTNFSLVIRPVLVPKSNLHVHVTKEVKPGEGGICFFRSPYYFCIGSCSMKVTAGNVQKNATGRVIGQFIILQ